MTQNPNLGPEPFSLGQSVLSILDKAKPNGLYVEDIISHFGTRSHAFIILFLCLPFLQPLPMFGLSTPLGLAISGAGVFMALGAKLWFPKKFMKKHISFTLIESSCSTLSRVLKKTEKLIKPRHDIWFSLHTIKILNGLLIALFGILLAMPIPIPFSNSVPAYFFLFNAIAWLERDGLLLVLSYVAAALGIVFFIAIGGSIAEAIYLIQTELRLIRM